MKAMQLTKAVLLVSTAGLMMGNQSCQQQVESTSSKPVYRKIVEMGSIQAQPIQLADGSSFDFKFVANQQLYGVIAENGNFALRSNVLLASDPSLATTSSVSESKAFNLSSSDQQMLQKSFDNQKTLEVSDGDFRTVFSRSAWCMVNLPQARLYGSVNSFEITNGAGLSLGYNTTGALTSGLGAGLNFSTQSAQLDLSMRAMPPIGTTILGATNVTATQTKTNIGLSINFGLFSIGPSAYFSTPLATVVKNGLTLGLDQLAASPTMIADEWYSRVFADLDTSVVLVGGHDVGYSEGDQLKIYNELYAWSGTPCQSTYQGGVGTGTDSLYATVEITSVGDQLSQARVIKIDPNSPQGYASVGAKVKLYKTKAQIDAEAAAAAAAAAQTTTK